MPEPSTDTSGGQARSGGWSFRDRGALDRAWATCQQHWVATVVATAGLALFVRLVAVAATGSHADANLQIYSYFTDLFRHGSNPWHAPTGGPISPTYGDNPPGLFELFSPFLAVHDSPVTLRVLFAVCDAATILFVGLMFPRARSFRLAFIAFYAFNPLVLMSWTVSAQDKTVTFGLIAVVIAAVELGRPRLMWAAAAVLAAVKWMTLFFLVPLLVWTARSTSRRRGLALVTGAATLFVVSTLPFFPSNLIAYDRRSVRTGIDPPIAESLTRLLEAVHLYTPLIPRIGGPLLIIAVWVAHQRRRVGTGEAIALCILSAYVLLPDESVDRLLLVTLPLLLVTRTSAARWAWWWLVSSFAAIGVYAGLAQASSEAGTYPALPGPLVRLAGTSGLHDVVVQNLLLVSVLAAYVVDRHQRRAAVWEPLPERTPRRDTQRVSAPDGRDRATVQ